MAADRWSEIKTSDLWTKVLWNLKKHGWNDRISWPTDAGENDPADDWTTRWPDLPYERSSSKELQDVPKPWYITKRSDRDHLTIKQLPDIFMTRRGYECQYHFSDRSRWNSCNDPCAGLKTFRKRRTGIFDHTCRTDPCPWLGDPVYLWSVWKRPDTFYDILEIGGGY